MAANDLLLALSTFPDQETARRVVTELVESKLIACGNIVPLVESIYRWEGAVQSGAEALVFFKLPARVYGAFEEKLRSLHPYDVPEIICLPITAGSPDYLQWVAANCPS